NEAGQVVWEWDSEAFGNEAPMSYDGTEVNLRFPGQVYDVETGLYYNYFRYYDSSTGRYVQSDPIGLEGGINTYAYVEGNPVRFVDFFGLCANWRPNGWTLNDFGLNTVACTCFWVCDDDNNCDDNSEAENQSETTQGMHFYNPNRYTATGSSSLGSSSSANSGTDSGSSSSSGPSSTGESAYSDPLPSVIPAPSGMLNDCNCAPPG
ncbi:MAG: RHS repeat-associated core domain-containing protein, partial [Gammaproteobacteria bacterium]|nr:RHS repeat-associated core domain-containing protein [Gammaproteobacteria bacterium]